MAGGRELGCRTGRGPNAWNWGCWKGWGTNCDGTGAEAWGFSVYPVERGGGVAYVGAPAGLSKLKELFLLSGCLTGWSGGRRPCCSSSPYSFSFTETTGGLVPKARSIGSLEAGSPRPAFSAASVPPAVENIGMNT